MSFFIFFCYNFIGDFMNFEKIKELITKNDIQNSIGTKQERTLHQYLKYYFCNESIFHEQKCCGYIVDILKDNQIIEIQTSSFNAMRKKLACLLNKYPITIVYPIINQKLIYNLDENGELISIKKSPKKENPLKIGKELYKINNLLNHPNLKFVCAILNIDEYRIPYINRYKQNKMTRINQVPKEIVDLIELKDASSFMSLIPFEDEFDAETFRKKLKLSLREASSTLIILRTVKAIEVVRNEGKKYIYKKVSSQN
jgi:hypothetical protein